MKRKLVNSSPSARMDHLKCLKQQESQFQIDMINEIFTSNYYLPNNQHCPVVNLKITENYLYNCNIKLFRKESTNTDKENPIFCKYLAFFQCFDDTIDTRYHYDPDNIIQKHPSRGLLRKRCSENIQQIYRRTPMPKCDFNKVAK